MSVAHDMSGCTPTAGGRWTETVLHSLNTTDGAYPEAGLLIDVSGNLYGTTYGGGAHNSGTVFELMPQTAGGWTYCALYSFNSDGKDGFGPRGRLLFDDGGNLYGTTIAGGVYNNGTAFQLLASADGGSKEKVLHSFGSGEDGAEPYAGLVQDASGNLYGTTIGGGSRMRWSLERSEAFWNSSRL
jgi:uncharacterized repeat protein (TIGR03803 family)